LGASRDVDFGHYSWIDQFGCWPTSRSPEGPLPSYPNCDNALLAEYDKIYKASLIQAPAGEPQAPVATSAELPCANYPFCDVNHVALAQGLPCANFPNCDVHHVAIAQRGKRSAQAPASVPLTPGNIAGLVPSITNEVLKAVVAEFDASELITQRETLSARVQTELVSRAGQFEITLDDISITHLTFGREFAAAIEAKQVASQEAEKAKFLVEKAEQVKTASVISAEGDSEAAELLAKAFKSQGEGLVELRRIETAEEVAENMSASRNVVYLPSGQQTLLALPQ